MEGVKTANNGAKRDSLDGYKENIKSADGNKAKRDSLDGYKENIKSAD